jgi:hypothetical protein
VKARAQPSPMTKHLEVVNHNRAGRQSLVRRCSGVGVSVLLRARLEHLQQLRNELHCTATEDKYEQSSQRADYEAGENEKEVLEQNSERQEDDPQ